MDAREVADALAEQRKTRERLGDILVRRGISAERVARALAIQLRLEHAPAPLVPDPGAARLLDRGVAARLRVVPLEVRDRTLRLAMADPLDLEAVDDVRFRTGRRVEALVASTAAVDAGIAAAYDGGEIQALLARLSAGEDADPAPDELGTLRRATEAAPIVAVVDMLLQRATSAGASDLHIEPAEGGLRVRARIDGLLRELLTLPAHLGAAVASRIKVMAGLDIATKRLPQDGRCSVRAGGEEITLRVSTLPSATGEKVVLRLLRQSAHARTLRDVGLGPRDRAALEALLERPQGAILVTGPTGSGKTTSLYSALASLDRERKNLVTLEDPVEYRISGVTQVPVRPRGGVDFAGALRAVLRQDPDVIMVGEMRDRETVEVGLAAALTGHLVLSTLHTSDAATAVTRLLDLGAPPYLIAGALIGVVAQRLVRRLCPACRVLEIRDGEGGWRAGSGCERCDGGWSGRIGVFEVLRVDEPVRAHILQRSGADAVRRTARRAGMRLLSEDALSKVRRGWTTAEEIRPILAAAASPGLRCPGCGRRRRGWYLACPSCGRSFARRCQCGQRLQRNWIRCPRCGESEGEPKEAARGSVSGGRGGGLRAGVRPRTEGAHDLTEGEQGEEAENHEPLHARQAGPGNGHGALDGR